mmetsp:Transcript_12571/g.28077  ORF Transcript_12571/g.28077 Transcript_12571/m.28077 type:complete len:81 (+) Transcript_12571:458-700(+)
MCSSNKRAARNFVFLLKVEKHLLDECGFTTTPCCPFIITTIIICWLLHLALSSISIFFTLRFSTIIFLFFSILLSINTCW